MILHFCPRAEWEAAKAAGVYRADSLASQGFIHCSTPEQVAIPATALARGRTDIVLLEIDERRLGRPVVWEQGDPPDPGGMVFPHVYEPIPAAAVIAVHDYLPGPDGAFHRPAGL
ncbi:DUF952 domain-containing protein [Amorphoplanes digitatis]|uniref:Uncharacterized protein (DUF952 family) n=1 Tax=Actinoplanes digitatis TaxID=1868 RepID=A0A7W7HT51_9ACTN|nr:DUF952 domain-containing protein [Actinoplanes digitatis]MBB4760320.1 uncharacterized protein (DUF952 family) [Actinoplanes digitatis]GID97497.1 glutathione S-transferase [Actinoplanes digitatis]